MVVVNIIRRGCRPTPMGARHGAKFCTQLGTLAVSLLLAACSPAVDDDRPVITAAEAEPVLGVSTTMFAFTPTSGLAWTRLHMAPADYQALRRSSVLKVPIFRMRFDRGGGCYRLDSVGETKGQGGFWRIMDIGGGYALTTGGETCVASSVRPSEVSYLFMGDDWIGTLGKGDFTRTFEDWAADKSAFYRRRHGIALGAEPDGATVRSAKPFVDYFNDTFKGEDVPKKPKAGIGFGVLTLEDKRNLARFERAEARRDALQQRFGGGRNPAYGSAPARAPSPDGATGAPRFSAPRAVTPSDPTPPRLAKGDLLRAVECAAFFESAATDASRSGNSEREIRARKYESSLFRELARGGFSITGPSRNDFSHFLDHYQKKWDARLGKADDMTLLRHKDELLAQIKTCRAVGGRYGFYPLILPD